MIINFAEHFEATPPSPEEIEEIMKELDTNKDGKLNF